MKKDFKECKEISEKYFSGNMDKNKFIKWSKENCDNCFFFKITGKKYCLFGGKNK